MKILLVGEYSNLHNSLKTGLTELGHEVTLVSEGDGFKKFSSDIQLKESPKIHVPKFLKKAFSYIFGYPYSFYMKSFRFQMIISKLEGYDIVQLINEHAIGGVPWIEAYQIKKLKKQNGILFLLCCGDDFNSINYYLNSKELKYSILTPYIQNKNLKSSYSFSLKYISKPFQRLSSVVSQISSGIIASDLDYHLPLKENSSYLGMIPNPVVLNKEKDQGRKNSQLNILLGVNSSSYIKKGIHYFEEALRVIKKKYPEVVIKKTKDLAFNKYIDELNSTDILLDQVYGYDQGYNALEAMALGKVVFTGAEQEFLAHYNLKEDEVVINALPDTGYLVKKLSYLIENPDEVERIGKNAKVFVRKHHNSTNIAQQYMDTWSRAMNKD